MEKKLTCVRMKEKQNIEIKKKNKLKHYSEPWPITSTFIYQLFKIGRYMESG